MRVHSLRTALLVALLVTLASCGGDGDGGFDDCGNGVLNDGEQCDDGNLVDTDDCLSTCVPYTCGDGFVNAGVEECDLVVQDSTTCQSLGFQPGTLGCTASCTFDTSGCRGDGPVPTPTATGIPGPTDGAATPTPTGTEGAAPTPTPTPGGGATCGDGEAVIVEIQLDAAITSARIDLAYPTAVNLPGSGTDPAVADRVEFTGSGLTVVNDFDQDGDLVDDTLTASLVGTQTLSAGTFATVTFDCVAGQPRPDAGAFGCAVVSASLGGTPVAPGCSVTVR